MLARRSLLAATFNAIATGVVAIPAFTLAQDSSTSWPLAAGPATIGSPSSRGPARYPRSQVADADELSQIRSSGSPTSRGRRHAKTIEETVAGATTPR